MRHVFVCTTEYADHWARTMAKKAAQMAAMSEEQRQRILSARPEDHADGHRGLHCGQTMGGGIYEMFQERLRAAGVTDVVLSPNACVAQHAYGCVIMVYPDGIWYGGVTPELLERIVVEHLRDGRPVAESVFHKLRPVGQP